MKVLQKKKIGGEVYQIDIYAPKVAEAAKVGQFVILQKDDKRTAVRLVDFNKRNISVVFENEAGLDNLKKGMILDCVMGPLGKPTEVDEYGNVCLVAYGKGIASLKRVAQLMKKKKNKVIAIIGAADKKALYFVKELQKICDNVIICTDDGSEGQQTTVDNALRLLLRKRIDRVYAVGPMKIVKDICHTSYQRAKTIVSLDAMMLDGIGISGSCRVMVDDERKFLAVDGLEFDGHKVDFEHLLARNERYGGCGKNKFSLTSNLKIRGGING